MGFDAKVLMGRLQRSSKPAEVQEASQSLGTNANGGCCYHQQKRKVNSESSATPLRTPLSFFANVPFRCFSRSISYISFKFSSSRRDKRFCRPQYFCGPFWVRFGALWSSCSLGVTIAGADTLAGHGGWWHDWTRSNAYFNWIWRFQAVAYGWIWMHMHMEALT